MDQHHPVSANITQNTNDLLPEIDQLHASSRADQSSSSNDSSRVNDSEVEDISSAVQVLHDLPKHPGGRPSKYNTGILEATKRYYQQHLKSDDGKIRMPFIEELALLIDIDDDTIVEWSKDREKEEFSATIKKIKILQKLRLQQRALAKGQPTGAIFLLKTNHGFIETEKQILSGDAGNPIVIDTNSVNTMLEKVYGTTK